MEAIVRLSIDRLRKEKQKGGINIADIYSMTDFRTFKFVAGDVLPFEDESFDFIYSEHLFEHLFLDEAVALFKECKRVMRTGAVIRTCVPDAELKIYEKPEFAGFPDPKMSFTDPSKHKTRWSVYSLAEIVRLVGFTPIPLVYCTKEGDFVNQYPEDSFYPGNPDKESVLSMEYIARPRSLIVDGQK